MNAANGDAGRDQQADALLGELQRLDTEAETPLLPVLAPPAAALPTLPGGGPALPTLTGRSSVPYERAMQEISALARTAASGRSYATRLAQAVYVNYASRMAGAFVGALMRQSPDVGTGLDFGTLGNAATPGSRAQAVYASTSAPVGGQHWDAFWSEVMIYAMATGHRWIVRDAPRWDADAPPTQRDEEGGYRPYLRHVSPLAVPDWHFDEAGRLQFLRIEQQERVFEAKGGQQTSRVATRHLLYTRRGFALFAPERGEAFDQGGWWLYDDEGDLLRRGTYADGEIPARLCYYERAAAASVLAEVSRPGLTEIGQCSISAMNLDSIADHDAKVSGMRRIYAVGADPTGRQHDAVVAQLDAGSRFVSVPAAQGVSTSLHDTGSSSSATAITARIEAKRKMAQEIAHDEATSAPDASGEAKKTDYREGKSPRLALMAFEMETAQTEAIRLLERGFDPAVRPSGHADWPSDFDLEPLVNDVKEAFEVLEASTAQSEDLTVTLLMAYLQQKGLIAGLAPAEQETIKEQLRTSLQQAAQAAERARDLQQSLLQGGGTGNGIADGTGDDDQEEE